jgi:hypothetical protein
MGLYSTLRSRASPFRCPDIVRHGASQSNLGPMQDWASPRVSTARGQYYRLSARPLVRPVHYDVRHRARPRNLGHHQLLLCRLKVAGHAPHAHGAAGRAHEVAAVGAVGSVGGEGMELIGTGWVGGASGA